MTDQFPKAEHSSTASTTLEVDGGQTNVENRTNIQKLCDNAASNFKLPKYKMLAESYATTWGFINSKGRPFKISNTDLHKALTEILASWNEWTKANLNKNNINPDATLSIFAEKYFSAGAHRVMANDQRRGFVHFISNIVHAANHGTPFDAKASAMPFKKSDYETALKLVSEIRENSQKFARTSKALNAAAPSKVSASKVGENVIFYGAPGTGKSNKIKTIIAEKGKHPIRTVFHPDLQNSDFFGCLKPQMDGNNVLYKFAPGPFMEALAEAYSTPAEPVYLVIEELNRAAAAAVFGDLFLLLDRDGDGLGEYDVSFPSPESRAWLEERLGTTKERIQLPSNLFIYATMNSADQGVYPLDTAFRRRWRQEYLPIDYSKGANGDITFIDTSEASHTLPWQKFVELLNDALIESQSISISEDRLLGQWFVKETELNAGYIPEKVLLYLWDDLLRHDGRELIFNTSKIKTFGMLAKAVSEKTCFLSNSFIEKLIDAVAAPEAPSAAQTAQNTFPSEDPDAS